MLPWQQSGKTKTKQINKKSTKIIKTGGKKKENKKNTIWKKHNKILTSLKIIK